MELKTGIEPFLTTVAEAEEQIEATPNQIKEAFLNALTKEEIKELVINNFEDEDMEALTLEYRGFDIDDFVEADPKKIHDSVWLPRALVNPYEGQVWFKNTGSREANKWLYYIGAENEAKVIYTDSANLIYDGVSESRLERFGDKEEVDEGESEEEAI